MNIREARPILAAAVVLSLAIAQHGDAAAQARDNEPPRSEQRDSSQPVNDTWITTKVKADLLATDDVPGSDIQVETVNGVVTLKGVVATQAQKDKAVSVTQNIDGVSRVEAKDLVVASR